MGAGFPQQPNRHPLSLTLFTQPLSIFIQLGATDGDLVPGGAGLLAGAGAHVVHVGSRQVAGHRPQFRILGEWPLIRVANDSRPGRLMDSKIMVNLKILVVILCHEHAVVVA